MGNNNIENAINFYELPWDTDYFKVNCAKVVLHEPLVIDKWNYLKDKFKNYQFISIENRNSEPINSQLIGKDSTAFLADINIQFKKSLEITSQMPEGITIHKDLEMNEQIIKLADFKFSKFTADPELAKRGGNQVYRQWVINSFGKSNKYYLLSKNKDGKINGFLLHSYLDNVCTVELVAVSEDETHNGIGTNLFKGLEYVASENGCDEIRVGTQLRNIGAINFYNKIRYKQDGCHQVYHLWNL